MKNNTRVPDIHFGFRCQIDAVEPLVAVLPVDGIPDHSGGNQACVRTANSPYQRRVCGCTSVKTVQLVTHKRFKGGVVDLIVVAEDAVNAVVVWDGSGQGSRHSQSGRVDRPHLPGRVQNVDHVVGLCYAAHYSDAYDADDL